MKPIVSCLILIASLFVTFTLSPRSLATEPDKKEVDKRELATDKWFVMQMKQPGIVLFRGKEVELKEIKSAYLRYRKDLDEAANPAAIIRANEDIAASAVQQLIGILQEAGVEQFALRARSAPKKQPADKKPSTLPNPKATRTLTLELTQKGKIVIGEQTVSPDDLKTQLLKQRDRLRTGGRKAQDVTVYLLGNDETKTGLIQTVIKQCRAVGFEKFNLDFSPDSAAKDKPLPRSVKLHLKADDKGDLAEIIFNGRTYDRFADVNRYLRDIHQTRPDSMPEKIEVAADYQLKYQYVIRAVSSVTGYMTRDGRTVRMATTIKFIPSKKGAEKEPSR